jgi:hypothetical protein
MWDLASWSASNDLEDGVAHALLRDYLGRMPTGKESLRLRLIGWLYDYVCLLWSELYLNLARSRHIDEPGAVAGRARLLAARLTHQGGGAG